VTHTEGCLETCFKTTDTTILLQNYQCPLVYDLATARAIHLLKQQTSLRTSNTSDSRETTGGTTPASIAIMQANFNAAIQ